MKKNILYICSWYPTPDVEIKGSFFKEQALLFKNDYNFYVLTINPMKLGLIGFFLYKIRKKYKYFDIVTPPKGIGIFYPQIKFPRGSTFFKPFAKFIKKTNYKVMCKYTYLSLIDKLKELNWSPDFIHAHSTVYAGILAEDFSLKMKIPYIISEHSGFFLTDYEVFLYNRFFDALKNADKVLVVSEHLKRQILMSGFECYPITVGNYVDENKFTIEEKQTKKFTILTVTNGWYIKDVDTLFKAIKLLISNKNTNFILKIIGGNLSRPDLINEKNPLFIKAKKYGITDNIEILNYIDREKMPYYYNNSDIFISTSLAETFGVAQCEAMMCGVPVIATANGGVDDIISDVSGIKIPLQDFKMLANSILKIMNKEFVFNPVKIRKSVVDKFGTLAFKIKIDSIYKSVE